MVRDEEWVPTAGSELMDHRPKCGRAQPAFGLGDVPKVATAEPQAESGVRAAVPASFLREKPERQAERLHRLESVGKDLLLELGVSVH
jgi:hypothetical protein